VPLDTSWSPPKGHISLSDVDAPREYVQNGDTVLAHTSHPKLREATVVTISTPRADHETKVVIEAPHHPDGLTVSLSRVYLPPLSFVEGVGEVVASSLDAAGYRTYVDLVRADESALAEVPDIGRSRASTIKEDVGYLEGKKSAEDAVECPVHDCYVALDASGDLYDHMIDAHGFWSPSLIGEQ
jgi:predicted flap endonuclease-1-like 5' DNA nuclease